METSWLTFLDVHSSCMSQIPSSLTPVGKSLFAWVVSTETLPALSTKSLLRIIAGLGEETPSAPVATMDNGDERETTLLSSPLRVCRAANQSSVTFHHVQWASSHPSISPFL